MSRKYVQGYLDVSDPQGGHIDNDLPGSGARPDNELPGGGYGGRPDNELPGSGAAPWGWRAKLIQWVLNRPTIGGGPAKPPGFPVLPVDPDWDKPVFPPHPWLPSHWVPVDPGFGKPPRWGRIFVDPGYGIPEGGGGRPDNELPGHWVPTDPDYDKPAIGCGGRDHKWRPLWVWLDDENPEPKPLPTPTPKPK